MLSRDKRPSFDAGEPGAKATGPADDGGNSGPAPTASLFALPGGSARQRLLAGVRRSQAGASDAGAAAASAQPSVAAIPLREDASEAAAAGAKEQSKEQKEQGENPDSLLYSKGDASASGFRPWYWSYERDGGPPPSDSAGTTTQSSAGAPVSVSPPDPVSAPATSPAISNEPQRRTIGLPLILLAGFSGLALIAGATLFVLSRAPSRQEAPALALAAPPPEAAPQKPVDAVLATKPVPVPEPAPPPKPVEAAAPAKPVPPPEPAVAGRPEAAKPAAEPAAILPPQEIATLMARGDQLLDTGDVAGARLFYERAAEGGSAAAATAAGKTYDPLFLAQTHARFIQGDPVAAARWYRKASAGGDKEADTLMQRLMAKYAG